MTKYKDKGKNKMLITPFKIDMIIDNLLILLKEEMYALGCVSAHQDWYQTSHLPMLSPHTHTQSEALHVQLF